MRKWLVTVHKACVGFWKQELLYDALNHLNQLHVRTFLFYLVNVFCPYLGSWLGKKGAKITKNQSSPHGAMWTITSLCRCRNGDNPFPLDFWGASCFWSCGVPTLLQTCHHFCWLSLLATSLQGAVWNGFPADEAVGLRVRSFTHSFIHSLFIHSLICSFIHLFVHSFSRQTSKNSHATRT